MKRKIKVWGKLKIYEASAVGIPAYPDAHASINSFSLIKSLSTKKFVDETEDIGDKLNLNLEEEEIMTEEEQKSASNEVETKTVDTKVEEKTDISEIIAKAIKEGIKDGLKELETQRGFVEQTQRVKSLGEIAMEQGLFKKI